MKMFVRVFLVAACLVACAHALPGARRDSLEDDFEDSMSFDFSMPNFSDAFNRLRQNFMHYFWNIPDITNINIPEGANTTSTVQIINGHVVTINETTYTSNNDNGDTAFRIRIIDVKPQNETNVPAIGSDADAPTAKPPRSPEPESGETVEDFNNEISKNVETLTA